MKHATRSRHIKTYACITLYNDRTVADENSTNITVQSLSVHERRGGERQGQVGLQNGSQMEIDAVTLRTEVDLQAQKLRQSGKESSSVTS